MRYQATITRTARDCNLNAGQITARVGIQGRVIVVRRRAGHRRDTAPRRGGEGGVNEKTITNTWSDHGVDGRRLERAVQRGRRGYRLSGGSADINDSYIFYIGSIRRR